jgi:hypothetical protein
MMKIDVPSINARARGSVDTAPGCDSHSRVLLLERLYVFVYERSRLTIYRTSDQPRTVKARSTYSRRPLVTHLFRSPPVPSRFLSPQLRFQLTVDLRATQLTWTIPVIPKCKTGSRPSPDNFNQKLESTSLWVATYFFPFRPHPSIVRPMTSFDYRSADSISINAAYEILMIAPSCINDLVLCRVDIGNLVALQ